jgi:hypothetical protein
MRDHQEGSGRTNGNALKHAKDTRGGDLRLDSCVQVGRCRRLFTRCFELSRPVRVEGSWSCDRQGYREKPRKAPSYTADENQHMEGLR